MTEPRKRPFHHPAPWQHAPEALLRVRNLRPAKAEDRRIVWIRYPLLGAPIAWRVLHNLNLPAELFAYPLRAGVATIDPHQCHPRNVGGRTLQQYWDRSAILEVRRMHLRTHDKAKRIDQQMPFATADLLAALVATDSPYAGRFDRLAINDSGTWLRVTASSPPHTFTQHRVEAQPSAIETPLPPIMIDRFPWRQVLRQ